jgi:hypothetical protein
MHATMWPLLSDVKENSVDRNALPLPENEL